MRQRLKEMVRIELCDDLPPESHFLSHEVFTAWTDGLQLQPNVELSYIKGGLGFVVFVKRIEV